MRKMGPFVYLSCLLLELWSLKCQKMAHFLFFLLMTAKISLSLDKIFNCICKILFSSFRKCSGLSSELPLARFQTLIPIWPWPHWLISPPAIFATKTLLVYLTVPFIPVFRCSNSMDTGLGTLTWCPTCC